MSQCADADVLHAVHCACRIGEAQKQQSHGQGTPPTNCSQDSVSSPLVHLTIQVTVGCRRCSSLPFLTKRSWVSTIHSPGRRKNCEKSTISCGGRVREPKTKRWARTERNQLGRPALAPCWLGTASWALVQSCPRILLPVKQLGSADCYT